MSRFMTRWTLPAMLLVAVIAAGCSGTKTQTADKDDTKVEVASVELGRTVDADKRIADKAEEFKPSDTIYASVVTNGIASDAELKALWTHEDSGQVVDESTQRISPAGNAATEFHIMKASGLPTGKYKLQIFLNGTPVKDETFEVKA